jgi:tetratricopeptide (TPR) repeat protein
METEERIAELYNECDVLYHRAMACLDKKDYNMAFSLFMEAVNLHDELGECHDDTLDFRVNIAHELFTTKRFYEASQFDDDTLARFVLIVEERRAGYARVLDTRHRLACSLSEIGDTSNAIMYHRQNARLWRSVRVWEDFRQPLGASRTYIRLTDDLRKIGRDAEAEEAKAIWMRITMQLLRNEPEFAAWTSRNCIESGIGFFHAGMFSAACTLLEAGLRTARDEAIEESQEVMDAIGLCEA